MQNCGMNRKSYIWNTTASTLNSAMSAILMLAVVRILGVEEGGIFALGYSVAQLMLTIGYYDMRAYQATDVGNTYLFGEYFCSRMVTCFAMLISSVIYIFIRGYSGDKFAIVMLLCLFKMTDAVEDVYHGQLQKLQHLDIAAFFQTMRLAICMMVFVIVLICGKNLLVTSAVSVCTSFILSTIPNIIIIKRYVDTKEKIQFRKVLNLLIVCLPLCIGSYLSLYIGNAPKYAIDRFMANTEQSYYNILFMPSYVINLFSGFILRPTVTTLANVWEEKKYSQFIRHIAKLFLVIICLTFCAMGIAHMIGLDILELIYAVDLDRYGGELIMLLLGGGFYALGIVMYYAITIARKQKYMLIVYGAAISYFTATLLRFIGFLIIFVFLYNRERGREKRVFE